MIAGELPPLADPEYRRDPMTGEWVVIAPERSARPVALNRESAIAEDADAGQCPFCPGHEPETPPAVWTSPEGAKGPDWRIRVVPNKFPCLRTVSGRTHPKEKADADESHGRSMFSTAFGYGGHEVVIERPEHTPRLGDLSDDQWFELLQCYRQRVRSWSDDPRIGYVSIFKNCGPAAGASQYHAHSQVIASTEVPPRVRIEYERGAAEFRRTGASMIESVVDMESRSGRRIVDRADGVTAFCPWASRFALETWVVPDTLDAAEVRFGTVGDARLKAFATVFGRVVAAVERLAPNAAYNFCLHDVPNRSPAAGYRWHFEIVARAIGIAGFEIGGGAFLNPLPPEWSAERIRQAIREHNRSKIG